MVPKNWHRRLKRGLIGMKMKMGNTNPRADALHVASLKVCSKNNISVPTQTNQLSPGGMHS